MKCFSSPEAIKWDGIPSLSWTIIASPSSRGRASLLSSRRTDDPAVDPARERAARVDGAAAFMITRVPPIPDTAGGAECREPRPQIDEPGAIGAVGHAGRRPRATTCAFRSRGNVTTARTPYNSSPHWNSCGCSRARPWKVQDANQSMDTATLASLQTVLTSAEVTQAAERVRILLELTPDILKFGENTQTAIIRSRRSMKWNRLQACGVPSGISARPRQPRTNGTPQTEACATKPVIQNIMEISQVEI